MYSLVYPFYFFLRRKARRHRESGRQESNLTKKIINYCEWFYNIPVAKWYDEHPSRKPGVTMQRREQRIIVSLTTYPKRIGTIWLTIETLMRQRVKPDEIILWLAQSQFPNGLKDLPENLLRLQSRGLSIRFCDDLRSHKKYYYALQEYSKDLVILADDDMFYPRDTIQKLLKMHKRWPSDICCMTAQVMEPDFQSAPSLWRNPGLGEHNWQHADRIQAFTGSGTLIPPDALPPEAFDKDTFQRICPYADDLWMTFMAHRKGTKITTMSTWRPFPVCIYGTAAGSLYYINGEGKQNDIQWQNLLDHYGVKGSDRNESTSDNL